MRSRPPSPRGGHVTSPPLALLLDVDGPLSNPDAKRIVRPSIIEALRWLPGAGVPVVLNTGRSLDFIEREVLRPMKKAGSLPHGNFHAVGEKGAVWLSVRGGDAIEHHADSRIAVSPALQAAVEQLVHDRYADTMFFDRSKRAMVTAERRVEVSQPVFEMAQRQFVPDLIQLARAQGYEVVTTDAVPSTASALRVDATTIATDLESVRLGKDLGAEKAFELLAADGVRPLAWRTVGDSPSDFAMADWIAKQGVDVRHVDVNPRHQVTSRPYRVIRPSNSRFDAAGDAYLDWVMAHAKGLATNEARFDDLGRPDPTSDSLAG